MKAQPRAHASTSAQHAKTARSRISPPQASLQQDESPTPVPPQRTRGTVRQEDPPLMRALLREAQRRGHQLQQMADSLGCTYGYVSQLRTGIREPQHIGQEFAQKAAAYLGVPTVLVKLLAGRLALGDFAWPQRSREEDIADGLAALRDDPVLGALVPDALYQAASEVQEFVSALYMECAEQHPHRVRALPRMLDYLQRAALCEAGYEVELAKLRESLVQGQRQAGEQKS
jgi:hypothetical protein